MMFDALIKLDDVKVSEREATIIKALIAGDPGRCRCVKYHVFSRWSLIALLLQPYEATGETFLI